MLTATASYFPDRAASNARRGADARPHPSSGSRMPRDGALRFTTPRFAEAKVLVRHGRGCSARDRNSVKLGGLVRSQGFGAGAGFTFAEEVFSVALR